MKSESNRKMIRRFFVTVPVIAAALLVIMMVATSGGSSPTFIFVAQALPSQSGTGMALKEENLLRALPEEPAEEHRLSGPYTYKNLTIYLVHGKDRMEGKKYLTLQEALKQKKVVVHETGEVNELMIENRSNQEVFIQAGDIVRGGRQDRALAHDLVLPPRSKKVPISSFCVEQGRWSERSGESSAAFSNSENQLSGRELKLAAKYKGDQGQVWKQVEETQRRLGEKVGGDVRSERSETSFELTLENSKVKVSADEYVKALKKITEGKKDVIGYVFAINGSVNSADLYGSSDLFRKLWPKLLRSTAVEAVAEFDDGATFTEPAADTVRATLSDAERGAVRETKDVEHSEVVTQESDDNVMFETRDKSSGTYLHRSYIKK